jgi:prepilin-type N-terminal cleavage/methylation domain-containing protein
MGFSLIELMVVLAIMLIVAAFAVPTIPKVIDGARIRGAMGTLANIEQICRTQAVKSDASQRLHLTTNSNRVQLFVTLANSTQTLPAASDPQLSLPSEFAIAAAPTGTTPPPLTASVMWGTTLTPNVSVDPYFNSRGLPCYPDVTGVCAATPGFVNYFTYRSGGNTRWAAISISPAGRIKSWFWYGNQWGD